MGNFKKNKALPAGIILVLVLFAGCNRGGSSTSGPVSSGLQYNGQDVSQPLELVMYFIGDKNTDSNLVETEINKILKERINAVIVTKNIPRSDLNTKYSLTIAGGEKIDLIYTSNWANYQTEANKGAFVELTDKILADYMPLTKQNEDAVYFAQNRIAGKTYMVPVNMANVSGTALAIRGDLREKYGLPKIKTMEDLEAYFEAVAADKNSGVSFAYHAAQDNKRLREIQFNQGNDFLIFAGALVDYFSYKYSSNVQPEDLFWIYSRPEYLEFLKTQKRFADIGAWSKSAVNNTTQMQDSFLNGISASFGNNLGTIGTVASQVAQAHPEWNPELVDLYPETNRFYLAATEGYAVPVSSQNQGRAFMSLDLLKFDENLYHLARNGIEGTHYTRPGPGLWMPGPAYDNYPFGVAISWGLKNKMYDLVRSDIFPDQKTISDDWNSRGIASPTASFAFDDRAVQNELANLRNIYLQHIPLLELGLVRDIEASLAEFQRQAEIAGLAKIAAEAQRQFKDHLDAMR